MVVRGIEWCDVQLYDGRAGAASWARLGEPAEDVSVHGIAGPFDQAARSEA
jgi:hypothetical protein